MSDTPTPYKRDSSAASVSAGDVYRVGLLIKHAASCECCRNAMIEAEEDNNNDGIGSQPTPSASGSTIPFPEPTENENR